MRGSLRSLPALLLVFSAGCGTTQLLRPVGAGNTRASASLGGPLIVFGGAPVPLPVSTVGVAHGVSESLDLHGDLHPTAAAFGVAGLGLGVAWHPLRRRGALTVGFDAYGFGNGADAVMLADPWIGGQARLCRWLSLGGGVHLPLRVATSSTYQRGLTPVAPTVFVQAALRLGRTTLEIEPRWVALGTCAACAAPDYVSLGTGTLGLVLGVSYDVLEAAR